jgi:CheY-like chemotaxis protein
MWTRRARGGETGGAFLSKQSNPREGADWYIIVAFCPVAQRALPINGLHGYPLLAEEDDMSRLAGRRILLVEDELLVAMTVEDVLRDEGCAIVGPIGRVEPALKAAREETLDAAILDVNLAGERVDPIVQALAERKIPFVFTTGYDRSMLPAEHANRPTLAKPFRPAQLVNVLIALL